jgi:hypothetical protein
MKINLGAQVWDEGSGTYYDDGTGGGTVDQTGTSTIYALPTQQGAAQPNYAALIAAGAANSIAQLANKRYGVPQVGAGQTYTQLPSGASQIGPSGAGTLSVNAGGVSGSVGGVSTTMLLLLVGAAALFMRKG